MKHYNKIVIGIDQSYQDTGISICADGQLKKLSHIPFNKNQSKSEIRQTIKLKLIKLITKLKPRCTDLVIIIERIRLKSQGFLNIDYIKSIGALNAVIVDAAYRQNIKVYSVDTRCWKSTIIGTSKPGANPYGIDLNKWPTIQWLVKNGYEQYIRKEVSQRQTKGVIQADTGERYTYNDNIADSACIALFGFLGASAKMQLET